MTYDTLLDPPDRKLSEVAMEQAECWNMRRRFQGLLVFGVAQLANSLWTGFNTPAWHWSVTRMALGILIPCTFWAWSRYCTSQSLHYQNRALEYAKWENM